ncbi:MAG: PEP-CTERM sorting domain-containing protein [Pseudomonadota bacterium]
MRRTHIVASIALSIAPLLANAEIVTYDFTGQFTQFTDWESSTTGSQQEWGNSGGPYNSHAGEIITGRVTYDTGTTAAGPNSRYPSMTDYYGAVISMTVNFPKGEGMFASDAAATLKTASQAGNGQLVLNARYDLPSTRIQTSHITFDIGVSQAPGNGLSSVLYGPGTFNATYYYSIYDPDNYDPDTWYSAYGGSNGEGKILSLTRVSAVPEPSSWAMFAAGALALAGMAYKRRGKQA